MRETRVVEERFIIVARESRNNDSNNERSLVWRPKNLVKHLNLKLKRTRTKVSVFPSLEGVGPRCKMIFCENLHFFVFACCCAAAVVASDGLINGNTSKNAENRGFLHCPTRCVEISRAFTHFDNERSQTFLVD